MQHSLEIKYQIISHLKDLEEGEQSLMLKAREALDNAYAPYSGFAVAAALELTDGTVLIGTNQENASYGLCLCAEQNVLAHAGANFHDTPIRKMAITARSSLRIIDHPISPCGACRQVISEHEDRHAYPIKILLQGEKGDILIFDSIKDLLPFSFSGNDLG
ncbi:MAG: cytidine deaminase [Saprospiraceae bacterium]|nr:cytidine deaminase [Saprospiraceae bacterium]